MSLGKEPLATDFFYKSLNRVALSGRKAVKPSLADSLKIKATTKAITPPTNKPITKPGTNPSLIPKSHDTKTVKKMTAGMLNFNDCFMFCLIFLLA